MTKNTSQNQSLNKAKKAQNDEFYTQLSDIENELMHYKPHFVNKVILCNCDDPRVSNFFRYFADQFGHLQINKLITTCYKNQSMDMFSRHDCERGISLEYIGDRNINRAPDADEICVKELQSDGDFRSAECVALLAQADVVVTNPPFSLFREYVGQLVAHNKKFVIVGNMNAASYKEVFPLIKNNEIWLGNKSMGTDMLFDVPEDFAKELVATKKEGSGYKIVNGVVKGRASGVWYTNLQHQKRNEKLILFRKYDAAEYPRYDNYNAIEVSKVKDIPCDYDGVMGVPISFLSNYNPDQFEIVGLDRYVEDNPHYGKRFSLNGKETYARILIKRKGA